MMPVRPISFSHRTVLRGLASLVLVLWGGLLSLQAQEIPQPMSPPRLVNDYAHLFSERQCKILEDSLVAFEQATSTQIAVVTVPDLGDYPAAEYATRLMEQWGVGSKEHDNGIVLLLKPRNQYGGGEVFIATGYGLEGALPDITVGRIIDNEMIPSLRVEDYYGATAAGTKAIRDAVRGEYTATPKKESTQTDVMDWISGLFSLGVIIFMVIILNRSYKGGKDDDDDTGGSDSSGTRRYYRRGPMIFPPLFGGYGGHRGGGFGGSGGIGGFGGFGGGSGGGGGAGRSF